MLQSEDRDLVRRVNVTMVTRERDRRGAESDVSYPRVCLCVYGEKERERESCVCLLVRVLSYSQCGDNNIHFQPSSSLFTHTYIYEHGRRHVHINYCNRHIGIHHRFSVPLLSCREIQHFSTTKSRRRERVCVYMFVHLLYVVF